MCEHVYFFTQSSRVYKTAFSRFNRYPLTHAALKTKQRKIEH